MLRYSVQLGSFCRWAAGDGLKSYAKNLCAAQQHSHGHLTCFVTPRHTPTLPNIPVICSAQSAQELFTDIDVGDPAHSFYNGGPATSGPNAGAFTTYWNIRRWVLCASFWSGAARLGAQHAWAPFQGWVQLVWVPACLDVEFPLIPSSLPGILPQHHGHPHAAGPQPQQGRGRRLLIRSRLELYWRDFYRPHLPQLASTAVLPLRLMHELCCMSWVVMQR